MEELKGRITARQDWIARKQESVDSKIEEATRPVAAQRAEAAQEHSALDDQVKELRYKPSDRKERTNFRVLGFRANNSIKGC